MGLREEVEGFNPENDLDIINEEQRERDRAAAALVAQAERDAKEAERQREVQREEDERLAKEADEQRVKEAVEAFLAARRSVIGQIDMTCKSIADAFPDEAEAAGVLHWLLADTTDHLYERTHIALDSPEDALVPRVSTDNPMDLSNAELIISRLEAEKLNLQQELIAEQFAHEETRARLARHELSDTESETTAASGESEVVGRHVDTDAQLDSPEEPQPKSSVDQFYPSESAAPNGESEADESQDVGTDIFRSETDAAALGEKPDQAAAEKLSTKRKNKLAEHLDKIDEATKKLKTKARSSKIEGHAELGKLIKAMRRDMGEVGTKLDDSLLRIESAAGYMSTYITERSIHGKDEVLKRINEARTTAGIAT